MLRYVLVLALAASLSSAQPLRLAEEDVAQDRQGGGPYRPAAGDKYFQYVNVPGPKDFEWGYRRGQDPGHFREEYLSQKDHTFKAKVKWGDEYDGYGEMFFDINHGPKYEEKPHGPPHPPPALHYAH